MDFVQSLKHSTLIETIIPNEFEQEDLVMEAIYGSKGIKAGKKLYGKRLLFLAAQNLIRKGAQAIILGCTEVPLVLKQKDFEVKLYDPMRISAKEIIKYIGSKEKTEVITVKYVIQKPTEI